MSDSLTASFVWDEETYLQAARLAYEHELKHSRRKYIGWLFIAMLQFGVVAAMKRGAIGLLLISTVFLIYWYLLRWPIRKMIIKKSFAKLPNANLQYKIGIDKNGIEINDDAIQWDGIRGVLALDDGIFVYLENESIFIPNKAFNDIEKRNDFLKILKKHSPNYSREK